MFAVTLTLTSQAHSTSWILLVVEGMLTPLPHSYLWRRASGSTHMVSYLLSIIDELGQGLHVSEWAIMNEGAWAFWSVWVFVHHVIL